MWQRVRILPIRLTILVACLVGVGCAREPLPNLLIVTFDTTRYDHFGVTGDPEAHTPVVDALAARGVLFEHAYASVPITLPSHTTIFTGLEPPAHGIRNNGRFRLPDEARTLAEILKQAGYDTAAFVSALVLHRRHNLGQGFDLYSDEVRRGADPFSMQVPERDGAEVTDDALAWLASRSGQAPFLLWAHYYDPHRPVTLELPYAGLSDGYRAEIAYADAQLGRLLEGIRALGDERDTLIAFTADHGESLGAHGEDTHAILAYDATLHVPLILVGPGVPQGVRSQAMARHVDLLPTLLGLLDVPVPEALPGRNLLDVVDEPAGEAEVVGRFECLLPELDMGWRRIEGIRTPRWKYTFEPEPVELYDVLADPDETRNLTQQHPEVADRMAALRAELEQREGEGEAPSEVLLEDLDPEQAAQLAALGYVEARASFAPDARPDPRRLVTAYSWITAARARAGEGHYEEAIDLLETLAESASIRPLALRTLASVYTRVGRTDDAVSAYRRYLELGESNEARFSLARILIEAGRVEEGLEELERLQDDSLSAARLRALALATLGRHEAAREVLDAAFRADDEARVRERARLVLHEEAPDAEAELRALLAEAPRDPVLRSALGFHLAVHGAAEQGEEALALLRELDAAAPRDAEVLANVGWGYYRLGLPREAVASLEATVELDPSRLLDRVRLAHALGARGEAERARQELQTALTAQPGAPWGDEARQLLRALESDAAGAES